MDQNMNTGSLGAEMTVATIGLWLLGKIFYGMQLADITNMIAIASGSIAIIVNWPKFKARILEFHKKYFQKKPKI